MTSYDKLFMISCFVIDWHWRSLEILRRNLSTSCKQTYKDNFSTPETGSSQRPSNQHFHRSDMTCFISPRSCRKVAASALTLVPSDRIPSYKRPRNELKELTWPLYVDLLSYKHPYDYKFVTAAAQMKMTALHLQAHAADALQFTPSRQQNMC